jgi:hypothetical protein
VGVGSIIQMCGGEQIITALILISLYAVIYTVISSLLEGEQRETIRGQDEYIS